MNLLRLKAIFGAEKVRLSAYLFLRIVGKLVRFGCVRVDATHNLLYTALCC